MLQAAIFDMDGLLIDSEPFWQQAELEVFPTVGVPITRADTIQSMGIRIDEVVASHYAQHPWEGPSVAEVSDRIMSRTEELIWEQGKILPGVREVMAFFREKGLKVALATSSPRRIIDTILPVLGLEAAFAQQHSAEGLPHGKPHPEIFLRTAAGLGVDPQRCLVLEDSLNGLIAAKAARMKTLVVPANPADPRFVIADLCLASLAEFSASHWEALLRD